MVINDLMANLNVVLSNFKMFYIRKINTLSKLEDFDKMAEKSIDDPHRVIPRTSSICITKGFMANLSGFVGIIYGFMDQIITYETA